MEVELRDIHSASLDKKRIQDVLETLSETVTRAVDTRDMELVRDPELRQALNIVEDFLRNSHRICYGGMAINAHLPKERKFYDFQKTLPDYDFFTPDSKRDVQSLLTMFKQAGFTEVSARMGMHEGTIKIFVNYTGVADITEIPYWMYNILSRHSIKEDGIQYADADFLRMNMYLELSRPRGEVERWDKVYKRLLLLNSAKMPSSKICDKKGTSLTKIGKETHQALVNYSIDKGLIFVGSDLQRIYRKPEQKRFDFLLYSQSPIICFTDTPMFHIPILRQIIQTTSPVSGSLDTIQWKSRGEILPEMVGIKRNGRILVLLVTPSGCNAYNTIQLPGKKQLKIAALDTAITFYYMLTFVKGLDGLVPKSIPCFTESLVEISMRTRDRGEGGMFPLFVEHCEGHQPSKASLLRAKAERVQKLKTRRRQRSPGKRSSTKKH